ncbi:MAG: histidine--tRNA ligase, partial [Dehalococcoidales bacterium]|nr:histidine--tRNA ligase [Dehalococcoidales bacterium]
IVEKEMYLFDDRGGNKLTLIPEGTASICRAYIEHGMHNLPQPVKLYYLTSIFRYERPQAGRYRQHHQFGYETIGNDDPSLDAEVIDMAWQFFRSLDIPRLSLSINSIGCKKCRPSFLAALKDYYGKHADRLCADCQVRLIKNPLRLLDCKETTCQPIANAAPRNVDHLCPPCAEHFNHLKRYLELLAIPFSVNHRLVRGLDYYTRTVFEIQPEEEGAQSTIGGGGRYDDLIETLGGKPTPALGFATGIERIIANLKKFDIPVSPLPGPQVFIAYLGDEAKDKAVKLAGELRQAGICVLETTGSKSLKAQLRQANTIGVRHTIIIGDREIESGTVILKDMTGTPERAIPLHQLAEILK